MNDIVLETENLTKYYGDTLALDHLNLRVPRGCIYGFLGRNGAGKTTAIKLMLGLLTPTAGSSKLLGCGSQELTPQIRQRIGYVTEGHRLYRYSDLFPISHCRFHGCGCAHGRALVERLLYDGGRKQTNARISL